MAKFCTECGKEIADNVAFCTECGAKAPADTPAPEAVPATPEVTPAATPLPDPSLEPTAEPTPAPEPAPEPARQAPPQAQYQPPQQQPPRTQYQQPQQEIRPVGGKYGVASTGAFFGMMFLFAIPVLGFLICLIMAFAPKNENIKHYARAALIWMLIGLVMLALLVGLVYLLRGVVGNFFGSIDFGEFNFGDFNIADIFGSIQNGGIPGGTPLPPETIPAQ